MKYDEVHVPNEAWKNEENEYKGGRRRLGLVSLAPAVQTEVLKSTEENDSQLLQLEVAIWIYELVFLVVEENEGDNGP